MMSTAAQIYLLKAEDMILVSFSPEELRRLRKEVGLTQGDIAKKADLSQQSISFYESGSASPTEDALRKLGKALGVVFVADWYDDAWEKETPRYKKQQGDS